MTSVEHSWRLYAQLILGIGITGLFFYMMAPFLIAILLGAITAILCYPLYQLLRRRLPKPIAGVLVTVGVTAGILLPLAFVLINGAQKLLDLIRGWRMTKEASVQFVLHNSVFQKMIARLTEWLPVNREWIRAQAIDVTQALFEKISQGLGSFLGQLSGFVLDFSILILSIYFLTVDGAKLLRFLSTISPIRRERAHELYRAFEASCRGVVLGMFVSSVVQGVLVTFFFIILSLPNAFLMGVISVVLGLVPVVGTAPITIGAVLYLFAEANYGAAITMGAGALMIGMSDNVVRPWVMKGQSEMHPLLALVSALGAVNLMGATGIFLGPIIAAIFISFLKILAQEIRREKQILVMEDGVGPLSPGR